MPRLLFRSAIFLASFLLFVSEPLAARQLLPVYGGSAAVWMTCLVFFQMALLAGYVYAHWQTRRSRPSLHLALLALCAVCAILWAAGAIPLRPAGSYPVTSIFAALALSIGLPFVILASTSPLLQVWLARLEQNAISYRLFALSNVASLLALLLYPTVIEPHLSLSQQRTLWAAGVAAFAAITAKIAWSTRLNSKLITPQNSELENQPSSTPRARLLWFLLPMAAAMQLSAVTAHLTSNIAAIPLLWILPLGVYLLSFILAFELPKLQAWRGTLLRLLAVMLASLGLFLSHAEISFPIAISIPIFLAEAFLACLFCNVEAYALRPRRASESTLFYIVLAGGGATGSFLIGIAAPLVFSGNYDLALTFLVTAMLALAVVWESGWPQRLLWSTGGALLIYLVFALHTSYHHDALVVVRNFYASLRVTQTVTEHGDPMRSLANGTIEHGTQIFSDDLRHTPTSYYAPDSGIGLALRHCCAGRTKRVGVVGLGAGTLAAYGKPGDTMRFYEVNPAVLPIARNLFTWLRDSQAQTSVVEGDGRASLASERAQHFDVLAVDAFSGDAIPLHLLTVEALAVYRRHLAPGGILAFHVSNRYVNLDPEIAELAASAGMTARSVASAEDKQSGEFRATWVLVTDNAAFFEQPELRTRALAIPPLPGLRPWTDGYSSLLPLLRWRLD